LTIALLLKMVKRDFGFPEYSNPEHRGNPDAPMSACRLVAEETGLSERDGRRDLGGAEDARHPRAAPSELIRRANFPV
jgi:hypothetical protein